MSPAPLPAAGLTGIGSLPGDSIEAALAFAFEASPELPWLPELPGRGPGADMLGRTLAALAAATGEFSFDLQPSGWRLTAQSRPGLDATRAMELLDRDLDAMVALGDFDGAFKTQLTGPWTLASAVELPRGGAALRDRGAVRDLVAGLAETAAAHAAAIRARVPAAATVLQLDEPALPAVLDGSVPTESRFSRIAAVPAPDVTAALQSVISAAAVPVAVHCCAANPPLDLFADAGAAAVAWDATALVSGGRIDEDQIGSLVERGVQLWPGIMPSLGPGVAPAPRAVADPVRRLWRSLGFPPERLAESVVLTTACGLAGASTGWMRESARVLRQAARALSEAPEILRT